MASDMETPESQKLKFAQREEMKKLRNCGLTYISRSGKVIAAKTQSDILCQCPQKCSEKLSPEVRTKLFTEFYKMGDHELQNEFLRAHIQAIPVRRRRERIPAEMKINGRAQRRVTCKYLLPVGCNPDGSLKSDPTVRGRRKVEVCQKAFMHMYAITEKRVRLQREKLIARLKEENDDYDLDQSDEYVTSYTDTSTRSESPALPGNDKMLELDSLQKQMVRDVTIVDNFFDNQLWKPEYMMPLKKLKLQKPPIKRIIPNTVASPRPTPNAIPNTGTSPRSTPNALPNTGASPRPIPTVLPNIGASPRPTPTVLPNTGASPRPTPNALPKTGVTLIPTPKA